jgi:hypothetical protein
MMKQMELVRRMAGLGGMVLALALSAPLAHATVTFTPGNNPQSDEENILLNSGATGSTVFGMTQQSNLTVAFSSTIDTLNEPSSGQARVGAQDGAVNDLTISVPGGYYHDLILNPFKGEQLESGTAFLTVTTDMGPFLYSYTLDNGNNFLTIVAEGGEKILSTTIDSANGFDDLRQPRISGATLGTVTSPVPEPCSLALLATGALPLLRRRRRPTA